MTPVLLLLFNEGHFNELVRSARLLKRSGRYRPLLVFFQDNLAAQRNRERGFEEGLECIRSDGQPYARPDANSTADRGVTAPRRRRLRDRIPTRVKRFIGWPLDTAVAAYYRSIFGWTRYFRAQLASAGAVIDRYGARLLVLAEDNPEYVTHCWVRAGHERGVRSVIVPYTVANKLEAAESYVRDRRFWADRPSNRIAARLYPRWKLTHDGRELVRLPAERLLALEVLRLAPPHPWSHNSGFTDAIATESEFMRRRYIADDLPADRLQMTGTLADDVLAAGMRDVAARRRLLDELRLPDDRPLLVCALPPDQFPSNRPGREFGSQRELLEFLVETIPANVIYRLHPRTRAEDMEFLRPLGARIVERDTAELVPLCDVFVASVSATIRWAIACGKPVVNFDVHRYRYHDFDDAPGVLTVETKADFVAAVTKLATDDAFRADLTARQEACAAIWGTLDGRAAERTLALFDRMSAV